MPPKFKFVTQEMFLRELASAEKYFSDPGRFVGPSHFINGHLGPMGFDYRASIKIAVKLQAIGRIEFYKIKPPAYDVEVTAIRMQESSAVKAALLIIPVARSFRSVSKKAGTIDPSLMSLPLGGEITL